MKIIDIIKVKDKGVAFEFFPPKTDVGKQSLLFTFKNLKKYFPLYVSMTCGASGSAQEKTKEATYMLLGEHDLVVMPHITCVDANEDSIKKLLDEYGTLGVENIMVLRGDPPRGRKDFDFSKQPFRYARDLVSFIKSRYRFCVGVAVYPEGHIEDESFEQHIGYTKQKIDAGADFAVTQMFFENSPFYEFLEKIKKAGIRIPVLPGILPLTDITKAQQFCSDCKVTIPKKIESSMLDLIHKPEDMTRVGTEFTIKQCQDLIANGHRRIHFFTLNKPAVMRSILSALRY